jgi:hypothetical protein
MHTPTRKPNRAMLYMCAAVFGAWALALVIIVWGP